MTEYRSVLERAGSNAPQPDLQVERVLRRRDRKRRNQRIRAGALGLAIAIAVGWLGVNAIRSTPPVPADPPEPSVDLGIFEPAAGRILYYDDSRLWAVDPNAPSPDSKVRLDLGGTAGADRRLSSFTEPLGWSSDGTELLFMRDDPDDDKFPPTRHLYILHADGTETQVTPGPVGDAAISPDGSRVVYSSARSDGLYVVDAEGGQPVRIANGEEPTFSPDGSQIAYLGLPRSGCCVRGGREHVWVANVDGTDAHEILADEPALATGVFELTWSPAGDRIAMANSGEGHVAIYTFAPDGSDFTMVIPSGFLPYWSPDGSQIAYVLPGGYTSVPGLRIADADGSNVRSFGFGHSGPWHPGESVPAEEPTPTPAPSESVLQANGEVLSFTGQSAVGGDLVAVDPETGGERVLVEDLDGVLSARWSADGRWVAYETPPVGEGGLWVVSASQEPRQVATGAMWGWSSTGAELATIRPASPLDTNIAGSTLSTIDPVTGETTVTGSIPEGDVASAPAWSPDGTRFVFGARGGAIYSVDVRGGARSLLVRLAGELDSVDQIAWSPDGAHIAVMNDGKPGGLYVMDADGSNVRVLLDHNNGTGVAWSPDGTRLAYADGSGVIWVAPMDGSAPTGIGTPLPDSCSLLCQDDLVWSPDGAQVAFRTIAFSHDGSGSVDASAIAADGQGEPTRIDEVTYQSWDGGSFSCQCS